MALASITIEQIEHRRWVAEIEVGGSVSRIARLRAESFDDLMLKMMDAYRSLVPVDEAGPPPLGDRPIDASALPARSPPPIGKRKAAEMRQAADNV